jgi:hypothetical protein
MKISFQQARSLVVKALLVQNNRDGLLDLLQRLHPDARIKPGATDRSLAHKIAWRLLP